MHGSVAYISSFNYKYMQNKIKFVGKNTWVLNDLSDKVVTWRNYASNIATQTAGNAMITLCSSKLRHRVHFGALQPRERT
jgi:hypothetical protein